MSSFAKLKDDFVGASLLCRNESTMSTSIDMSVIVENAFDQISQRSSKRAEYYQLIANYIQHHKCPKLSSIIERFPTLIEASVSDDLESTSVVFLLQETIMHASADISVLLNKVLSKLVSTSCKMVTKYSSSDVGLLVLEVLGKSKLRSLLVPNAKSVQNTCFQALDKPTTNIPLLASVLSLFLSIETADVWTSHWVRVVQECSHALATIGVRAHGKQKSVDATGPRLIASLDSKQRKGAAKAVHVLAVFKGLCAVLTQMLVHGCATGPVSLDLTAYLPMAALLLGANADISTADPVNFIEGDCGVSPVDVCLVASEMKAALLAVTRQLLQQNHPHLAMVAVALFRPVAALLNKSETRKVPRLLRAVIESVGAAAWCFPNVVADSLNGGGASAVLELLRRDMEALTAVRSTVTLSGEELSAGNENSHGKKGQGKKGGPSDSNGNMVFGAADVQSGVGAISLTRSNSCVAEISADVSRALFAACESILTHCSATLSAALRLALEEVVGQGLVCLAKGLLPPQYADRRMHRAHCELLRCDPAAQGALLRLATVEVLVPPRTGICSSNVSLLKRVAEACARQGETAADASRALLVIGALTHPVAVALPAVSAVDLAKSHLSNAHATAGNASSAQSGSGLNLVQPQSATQPATEASSGSGTVSHAAQKRGRAESEYAIETAVGSAHAGGDSSAASSAKRSKTWADVVSSESSPGMQQAPVLNNVGAPPAVAAKPSLAAEEDSENEDDESLPDLDI